MWISIALGSGALAVVAAVPLLFVVCRDCLTPSARSRHRRALCAHGRALFDRAAKAVDPLTTWGYRHRGALALQRSGVEGWTSGHLFAMQLAFSGGAVALVLPWVSVTKAGDGAAGGIEFMLWAGGSVAFAVIGWLIPGTWLRHRRRARLFEISRGMPSFLDLLCLGLDCGANLQGSVQLALEHMPAGALRSEWNRMLLDMRSGVARAEALRQLSDRVDLPAIRQLVTTLAQGERVGLSLTRILGDFARHERARRMMAAEKQAMRAPVKMLVPLSLCIFPCTFLILGFPVLVIVTDLSP